MPVGGTILCGGDARNLTQECPHMQVQTSTLKFEALQDMTSPNEWRVEAIDIKAGDVFIAIFCGPLAEERANEYARFKNSQ